MAGAAPPAEPALAEIDKAVALGLDDSQRGLLEGLRALVLQDYTHGLGVLRPLSEKYPEDRDILYVLFESLFHGGQPAEAMGVFHRIVSLEPRFRLALVHSFTFYIARGDDAGMTWALNVADPTGDPYNKIWEPRVLIARREYDAATRLLSRMIDETNGPAGDLQLELATVYAMNNQIELATSVVRKMAETSTGGLALSLMGLAILKGDEPERKRWLEAAVRAGDIMPNGPGRNINVQFTIVPALFASDKAELADLSRRLDASIIKDFGRSLNLNMAQALVAEQLGDKDRLTQLAASTYPEVSETAKSALARIAGDHKAAAEAMRRAIAATGDARYLIDMQFLLASDLHELGDIEGMKAACDEVIRPRLFSWAWAATAPKCRAMGGQPPKR